MKSKLAHFALLAAVPLSDPAQWQDIAFNQIPKNVVTHSSDALTIQVAKSASPLIYPLPVSNDSIKKIKLEIEISGAMNGELKPNAIEEDSYLRVGLVLPGTRTLNFAERLIAAGWIKKLFSLAPKGSGVDKILFFNIGRDPQSLGQTRIHPSTKLMEESIAWIRKTTETKLLLEKTFERPLKASAFWLSADGDDTKSTFNVVIKKFEYE